MSGHTKGPWFVQGARMKIAVQSAHSVSRYDEEKKQDEQICAVWYDPKTHLGFADARLIAAAPDLLEALKMAQLWLDVDGRYDMQVINAAISKATGEA